MTDAPEKITVSWTYHEDRNPRPVITTDDPMANNWGDNDVPYLRSDLVPSWQPIETAPRDGMEVQIGHAVEKWVHRGRYSTTAQLWVTTDGSWQRRGWKPTHWMPLPEPPDA